MATQTRVSVKIDHTKLNAYVSKIATASLERAGSVSASRMRSFILGDDLVHTGKLLGSIAVSHVQGPDTGKYVLIGTPLPYAKYPEYGTRAHGPVTAKFLRFKPKGSSTYVFAKWVRGVRPYRFAQKTLDEVRPSDFV